jgi:hypothetical protein
MIKVGLVSLGCAKNLIDSEIMVGHLQQAGMTMTPEADLADVLIINTCSFIDMAKKESVGAIHEAVDARGESKKRKKQKIIVAGCLSQRFREELPTLMPDVDAFIGLDQITQVAPIIQGLFGKDHAQENLVTKGPQYIPDYDTPRFRLTPKHMAYVKIAEGCNHPCSFCIIPKIRGRHRSRTQESVVKEVRDLVKSGVEEGAEKHDNACKLPAKGFFFRPTIFANVSMSHRIAREEIFGPVLSILTFRTLEEAVEKANNTPYGLSAGVWTDKCSRILKMSNLLKACVVWANTYNKFDPTSPFGGFKESGFGREGGKQGLLDYLKAA